MTHEEGFEEEQSIDYLERRYSVTESEKKSGNEARIRIGDDRV
jgi:hypothetical protein